MTGKPFFDTKICVHPSDNSVESLYDRGSSDYSFFNCGETGIFFYSVSDHLSKKIGSVEYLHVRITCDSFVFHLEGMKIILIIDFL